MTIAIPADLPVIYWERYEADVKRANRVQDPRVRARILALVNECWHFRTHSPGSEEWQKKRWSILLFFSVFPFAALVALVFNLVPAGDYELQLLWWHGHLANVVKVCAVFSVMIFMLWMGSILRHELYLAAPVRAWCAGMESVRERVYAQHEAFEDLKRVCPGLYEEISRGYIDEVPIR